MNAAAHTAERTGTTLYSRAAVVPDSVSEESRSVDVIASTDALDAHGTILRQNWQLERYADNPVVLYAHDQCELPIGLASNVRVEDGSLRATLTFSTEDLNPQAEQIWKNVKAKVIRGVSVGFWPHSVSFETKDDRDFIVLDDNELFEISIVPVGSNPETLAQMRQRALPKKSAPALVEPSGVPEIVRASLPVSGPPPAAKVQPAPVEQGPNPMTENNSSITPTILRALGLPPGSTESDGISCASRQHELEVGIVVLLGLQSTAEALGAVRGLKAKADESDKLRERLAKVETERDNQNFDVQIQRGVNERKLSPDTARLYREEFTVALADGRGAEAVARLKGFVDVAPTLHAQRAVQPKPTAAHTDVPLEFNGLGYRDLKPAQRAQLARQEPDLYRLMKDEWEASGRPQPTKTAAA